jgi:hypothetical protein
MSIPGKEMEESQLKLESWTKPMKEQRESSPLMETGKKEQKKECLPGEKDKKSVRVPSYVTVDTILAQKPTSKTITIEKETFCAFREWYRNTKERDYQTYILAATNMKLKK